MGLTVSLEYRVSGFSKGAYGFEFRILGPEVFTAGSRNIGTTRNPRTGKETQDIPVGLGFRV